MKIELTLSEAFRRCNSLQKFCDEFGWSEWACAEGGGDTKVYLTEEEAKRHGII
jgi:hypothetical protein